MFVVETEVGNLGKVSGRMQFDTALKKAVEFHGHVGAFLVIGVRMGKLAERILKCNVRSDIELRVTMKVPFVVPFSCTIDGVQVTTKCTIGNQKLAVQNSRKEICADFEVKGSNRTLRISVKPELVSQLRQEMTKGVANEELAQRVAAMSERQLFALEKKSRGI
jgi:formylmethanofuran dehydrogenase subunit E